MIQDFLAGLAVLVSILTGGYFAPQPQLEPTLGLATFKSIQLATDPDNGECLETDGTNNIWSTCATGGSGGSGNVSTSTQPTIGNLAFWTTSGATPELLGTVGTTTLTASSPLSLSNPVVKVGGSNSVLTLDTSGDWTGTLDGHNGFAYPFPNNATTTGLGLYASTTIGAGARTTGLTVSGGATTTGIAYFAGATGVTRVASTTGVFIDGGTGTGLIVNGSTGSNAGLKLVNYNSTTCSDGTPSASRFGVGNNALSIGAPSCSNGRLIFENANGSEWARFDSSGRLGIGSTTPYVKLAVSGETVAANFTATTTATNTFPNLLSTNATTTSFAITGITSSLLKTDSSGNVLAAVAGTDYATPAMASFPFTPAINWNATSTLILFSNGIMATASSTIGNGTATGGLTVSGNATTTGGLYIGGSATTTGVLAFPSTAPIAGYSQIYNTNPNTGIRISGTSAVELNVGAATILSAQSLNIGTRASAVFTPFSANTGGFGSAAFPYNSAFFGGMIHATSTNFTYASTTQLTSSGNTWLGTITGPLQAISGLVSATSTIGDAFIDNALTINSAAKITTSLNSACYFRGGDDAELCDYDSANGISINGVQDATISHMRLGTGGGTINGATGNIGINDLTPNYPLDVTGAGRFTGLVDASFFTATTTAATSTFTGTSITGTLLFGGDYIADLVGTGLALSGQTLTTTLGTAIDISAETNLTAGDALTLTDDDIDFDGGATPSGDLGGTWASPSVTDDSHAHTSTTISGLDISDDTNLAATYPIILTGDTLSYPATSTLYGTGTAGQVLMWSGSAPVWAATSTCIAITGSAALCDGDDATGGGGSEVNWTFATNKLGVYPSTTTNDVWMGSTATSTAPFWWDVSATTSYIGGPNTDATACSFCAYQSSASILFYGSSSPSFSGDFVRFVNSAGTELFAVDYAGNASSTGITSTNGWFTNLFIGADTVAEYVADTAGAMFTGNTETGISATYQDADNTVDLVVDDVTAAMLVNGDFGDFSCNGTTCTVDADSIALGTDTTNNYVATVSSSGSVTVGNSGSETAAVTVNLNMANANTWTALQTFASASSTYFSTGYASSTLYYGAGLANCNTGNMLTYLDGRFGCEDDSTGAGGGAFAWTPTTNFGQVANATTTSIWMRGTPFSLFASSTAVFANATTSLLETEGRTFLSTVSGNVYIGTRDTAVGTAFKDGGLLIATSTNNVANGPFSGLGNFVSSCEGCNSGNGNVLAVAAYGLGEPGVSGFKSRGSAQSPSAVQADDTLYFMGGRGYGASAWNGGSKAAIQFNASQTHTNSANGTYITLETTPNDSTSRAERVRIEDSGDVGIATTSPEARLDVWGVSGGKIFTLFTDVGTKIMEVLNTGVATLLGAWDFGGATSLEIPNAAAPTVDAAGELALDTTSNNLIIATSTNPGGFVVASATTTLAAFNIASTTPEWIGGTFIDIPTYFLPEVATAVICFVRDGTSQTIRFSDASGTNDTNTITCTTTETQYALTTNNTWIAYEPKRMEFGTKTGTPNRLVVRLIGYRTSD